MERRIYFKDNPWIEGHPITVFDWTSKMIDGEVWFDFHLETANYYSERKIEYDEKIEYTDWEAPIAWSNFHCCTLSSTYWGNDGFKVCPETLYGADYLDGLELEIDPDPEKLEELDDLAFHIYLLGHDAVAKHGIKFIRHENSNIFDIQWSGKIALAYVGDYEFRHDFTTIIKNVAMPKIP